MNLILMTPIMDYFLKTYIGDDEIEPNFHITLWNHYHNQSARTNNESGEFNSKLIKYLSSKLNKCKLIEMIKWEESSTFLMFRRI